MDGEDQLVNDNYSAIKMTSRIFREFIFKIRHFRTYFSKKRAFREKVSIYKILWK